MDSAEGLDETVESAAQAHLVEKNQYVFHDQQDCDHRDAATNGVIAERDHLVPPRARRRPAAHRGASRKDRAPWGARAASCIIRHPAAGTAGAVPLGEEESMKSYPAEQIHNVVL